MGGDSLTIGHGSAKGVGNAACLTQLLFNSIVQEFGLAAELVGALQMASQFVLEMRHPVHATRAAA
jgi:hypothetical protein